MGLYLKQDETRSQLTSQTAANLQQRLAKRSRENVDTQDAMLLKNQRQTTGGGLFWAIIITLVVLAAVVYVIFIL